jgi:hypothetical protein
MKLTVTLRLDLSAEETRRLLSEVRRFNEAAQWLSDIAFAENSSRGCPFSAGYTESCVIASGSRQPKPPSASGKWLPPTRIAPGD